MAEYCTTCAQKLNAPIDINIEAIYRDLKDMDVHQTICEGCGLRGIGKKKGKCYIGFADGTKMKWQEYALQKHQDITTSSQYEPGNNLDILDSPN